MKSRLILFVNMVLILALLLTASTGPAAANPAQPPAAPQASYSISGRVVNSNGDPLAGVTVQINASAEQTNFSASPTSGSAPLQVQFSNAFTADFTSSLWDFGDGGTSTQDSPAHTYTAPGAYTVTLTVNGSGGSASVTKTGCITVWGQPASLYLPMVPRRGAAQTQTFTPALSLQGEGEREERPLAPATYSAITGADGKYTISGLPAGLYQETASQGGNAFDPVAIGGSLPPSARENDFTCTNCGVPVPGDMFTIPAGNFQMGCSPNDTHCSSDEKPLHRVYMNTYDIDKYEVTNARYKACEVAGGCSAPEYFNSYTRSWYYGNPSYNNYPVIRVSWYQAYAFCHWDGKRLPTEAEWEKAARGSSDTRIYPWGDRQPDCTLANFNYCVGDTSEVGSYPAGASPFGALDMAGNVWEWVSDWYAVNYYGSQSSWLDPTGPASGSMRVLRGGDFISNGKINRVSVRSSSLPDYWLSDFIGFRCARW